jgi:DNA polymerase-4
MDRYFGCERYAAELRQKIIRESGLPLSMGISTNKTVSKVATGEAKPNGKQRVWQGLEKPFLSPLPVRKIPMIGVETAKTLQQLGIQRIGTLQQIAPERLQTVFGKNGIDLWQRANGIDERAVEPYLEEKSISHEHTFDQDTINVSDITGRLVRMSESLGKQLRELGKMGTTLTVKVRYADFNTHSKQTRIPLTASDEALMAHAKRLLEQVWERRQRIRLVGLRVSGLVTGSPQLDLFDGLSGGNESKKMKLYAAMDQIKDKYGKTAVGRAAGRKPRE